MVWVCATCGQISYLCVCVDDEGTVTDSPNTGLLLSTSSKTLLTKTPGVTSTSGHAAISPRGKQGKVRADSGVGGLSSGPFHWVQHSLRGFNAHLKNSWRHITVGNIKASLALFFFIIIIIWCPELHSEVEQKTPLSHTFSLMLNHR